MDTNQLENIADPGSLDPLGQTVVGEDYVQGLQRSIPATRQPQDSAQAQPSPATVVPLPVELETQQPAAQENRIVDRQKSEIGHAIKSAKILIVDDEEVNVLTVQQHLVRAGYSQFVTTTDARLAVGLAKKEMPDLILLDIKMPNVNGLEIMQALSSDTELRNLPVLILTASTDPNVKRLALELGANDFLTKPVDANDLIPRVRNALVIKYHYDQVVLQKAQLEQLVKRRTDELYQSRQQIILSLARAAEHRDNDTGNHVLRVGWFAGTIAKQLGWQDSAVEMIQQAAQLHDVGKIGVPDSILFKPARLAPDEYDVMKHHCSLGKSIISPYAASEMEILRSHARLGENILHVRNSPLMMMAARIAQTHHEHWDGRGYPLGLAGEDIPLEGRITAVADVYDALSSKRPYKEAFPRQKCFDIMTELRGTQFDPTVLDAFFACSSQIIEIQLAFMDD